MVIQEGDFAPPAYYARRRTCGFDGGRRTLRHLHLPSPEGCLAFVQSEEQLKVFPQRSARRFFQPELDVLRFFAFALVFAAHAVPPRRTQLHAVAETGTLGVCLFFVLSSFLITTLLLLEQERTGTVNFRAFYARRILRIWPLLLFFVGFATVFGWLVPRFYVPWHALAYLLLLAGNFYVPLHGYGPGFLGQLWSISLEEQFYLIWPAVFLLLRRGRMWFLIALPMVSVAAIVWLCRPPPADPVNVIFPNTLVQFQMFGFGAAIALVLRGTVPTFGWWVRGTLFTAAWLLYSLCNHVLGIRSTVNPGAVFLVAAYGLAGCGSVLFVLAVLGARLPRWFGPLRYLGKISYGLYVYHGAALLLADALAGSTRSTGAAIAKASFGFALSVTAAALSYRYLELPFIRWKEKLAIVPSHAP